MTHAFGFTGAGQTIAVIDTGISLNLFDFRGRVVAEQCFCSSDTGSGGCCPNGAATQSGAGSALDDNGHGTNVTGIAAGGGAIALAGAAPAARIVAVKVIDANNRFCCFSDVLAALDWVRGQHPEAKIVNASLGTSLLLPGNCGQASAISMPGATAIDLLARNDSLVFASAGNQGNADAMSIPACLSGVVGVGASWDRNYDNASALGCTDVNPQAATPTCFSNSSAGTDLYAPGAFITSSGRGGGLSTYAGTSQASPLSAGCAALLRSVVPDASAASVRAALQASPTRMTDPKNGRSFPLLDCADALARPPLTCAKRYRLSFLTFVRPGATLTIDPGTTIVGDRDSLGALVVQPGARLIAEGTPERPIVFTSAAAPEQRRAGDWGGLLLLGRAPTNLRGADGRAIRGKVEGIASGGEYGGDDPGDSSGVLRYVRVEYSGTQLGPNNEINGVTLAGVGRGTVLDHVQVRHTADDCYEFFGGTVDAHHLLCQSPGDDGFDWDLGYTGRLQFLLLRGGGPTTDSAHGLEGDNDPGGSQRRPVSAPRVYNATLCGRKQIPVKIGH